MILISLAAVDLLGSMLHIPLAFSTMIISSQDNHLYNSSLAQQVLGPCLFWGYITCFFLLSVDRNDSLRKDSNRQEFLTSKRILVVLIIAIASAVGMAVFFVLETEYPNPLLPRKSAPIQLTAVRGALFLLFVIAVFSNIYLDIRVIKLVREHSKNMTSGSRIQRNQWQAKERAISWTIIQVILVVRFSYVPYIVASIIYTHNNVRSLDAIAICRSLTYLKYAVNAFIFTRLDGRFLTVFFNILQCNSNKKSNKICAKPLAPRVLDNMHRVEGDPQSEKVNDELPFNPKASSGKLTYAAASRRQILLVSEGNRNRQRT